MFNPFNGFYPPTNEHGSTQSPFPRGKQRVTNGFRSLETHNVCVPEHAPDVRIQFSSPGRLGSESSSRNRSRQLRPQLATQVEEGRGHKGTHNMAGALLAPKIHQGVQPQNDPHTHTPWVVQNQWLIPVRDSGFPCLCCPVVPLFPFFGEGYPFQLNQQKKAPFSCHDHWASEL